MSAIVSPYEQASFAFLNSVILILPASCVWPQKCIDWSSSLAACFIQSGVSPGESKFSFYFCFFFPNVLINMWQGW